jgi:hypothetical protein
MSKVVQLKASPASTRAARVRSLLKDREKAEEEIAAILREQLDDLGEKDWLVWCDKEFGWARRTAYRHLDPKQMESHREKRREQRAHGGHIEQEDSGSEVEDDFEHPEDDVEDPANYRTSFLLRAEQAIRFAIHNGPVTRELVVRARAVAEAWSKLADKLERSL